jgi:dolichol-phosphate mannosyltransferase
VTLLHDVSLGGKWLLVLAVLVGIVPLLAASYQFLLVALHSRRNHYDKVGDHLPRTAILIPAWNEEAVIWASIDRLMLLDYPRDRLRICVVDDASTDATPAEIKDLIASGRYPGLKYLRHATKSGQSTAIRTAILAASAPIIATMYGDGQNDPRDIVKLLEKLGSSDGSGPALIGGVRTNRKAEGSKRWASKAANWIRDSVLQDGCPDTGCGIKVYWRDAFLRLPFFASMHRYMPALFKTYGYEIGYVPVNDRARQAGVSKYNNLNRALVGLYDLVGVSWLRRRTVIPKIIDRA